MADSGGEKNDPKKVESLDDQTQPDKPQVFPTMTGPEPDQKVPQLYRPRTQKEIMPRSENMSGSSVCEGVDKVDKPATGKKVTKPIVEDRVSGEKFRSKQRSKKNNQAKLKTKPSTGEKIPIKQEEPKASLLDHIKNLGRHKQKSCPTKEVDVRVTKPDKKASMNTAKKESSATTENIKAIQDKKKDKPGQFFVMIGFGFFRPYKILTKEEWEKCKGTENCDCIALLSTHPEPSRADKAAQSPQGANNPEQTRSQPGSRKKLPSHRKKIREVKDDQSKETQDGGSSSSQAKPEGNSADRCKKSDEEKNAAVRRSSSSRRRPSKET